MHNRVDRRQCRRGTVFQIGIDRRCAHCHQFGVRRCRACEGDYLMAMLDESRCQAAAEQAGTSRDEDLHCDRPFVWHFRMHSLRPPWSRDRISTLKGAKGSQIVAIL